MANELAREVSKYFPPSTVKELTKDLKGKKYRINVVERAKTRDLDVICSNREIRRFDVSNREILTVKDDSVMVYYGDIEVGNIVSHSVQIDSDSYFSIKYEKDKPKIGSGPILLVKKGKTSDLMRGFFNYGYNNVYIIK